MVKVMRTNTHIPAKMGSILLVILILFSGFFIMVSPAGESKPPHPLNLTATVGKGYVLLHWDPPHYNEKVKITGYEIYRSPDASSFTYIGEVSGSTYTYNDTSVEMGESYSYYVTAINASGTSKPSNIVQVTVGYKNLSNIKNNTDNTNPILSYIFLLLSYIFFSIKYLVNYEWSWIIFLIGGIILITYGVFIIKSKK